MKLYEKYVDKEKQEKLKKEYEDYISGKYFYQLVYKHTCAFCGDIFYSRNVREKYCSQRCINDEYIARRKERKALEKQKVCEVCGKHYTAKKKDSKYCSNACKQKAYRMKKSVTNSSCAEFG